MRVIDFRSDTKTLPSPDMREAMAADMLGKEAALFVSSGTMGNLVAMLTHCGRGDEVIAGDQSHIVRSEAGGASEHI